MPKGGAATGRRPTWRRFYAAALSLPGYRWSLGRPPPPMIPRLEDPWPGNARRGREILGGHYTHYGQTRDIRSLYRQPSTDDGWAESWHGFAWLRDIIAGDGERAAAHARHRIREWILHSPPRRHIAWRADVIAERVQSWLRCLSYLEPEKDEAFHALLHRSLSAQARHLCRVRDAQTPFEEAFRVFAGMACCALAMPAAFARTMPAAVGSCRQGLAWQLRRDGCHYERSPRVHFQVLKSLIDLREYLRLARHDVPDFLERDIPRMGRVLASMCHPDGGLSLFNDSDEGEKPMILRALKLSSALPSPRDSAVSQGFQRLEAGSIHLFVDPGYGGDCAPPSLRHRHAGTASFEVSIGQERLIVNGGAFLGDRVDWRTYMRASSVHSTLSVDDTNSDWTGLSDPSLRQGRRYPPRALSRFTRHEEDGKTWIDIRHEGYRRRYALIHRRRFYLDRDDLRGEDRLEKTDDRSAATARKADIRFHLHPDIRVRLIREGRAAILHTARHGAWMFRAGKASMTLDPSVYVGSGFHRRPSAQLVARTRIENGSCCVQWALQPLARNVPSA